VGYVFAAPAAVRAVRASSQASRAAEASAAWRGRMRRRCVRGSADRRGWAGACVLAAGGCERGCAAPQDPRSDIRDQFEPLAPREFIIIYYFPNHSLPDLFSGVYRDQGGPPIRVPHE